MHEILRLALAQMTSSDDISANLDTVELLYKKSISQQPDLVVFPENTLFMRLQSGSIVKGVELNSEPMSRLSQLVESHGVPLLLTTAIASNNGLNHNATVLLEKGSRPRIVYSKIHLFDVDVKGAPPVRESEHFHHGQQPSIIEVAGWRIGLTICYDLRFAELFLQYAHDVDLVLVPSAFLVPTGEAHWHVLLRARAIEAQAFVAAPAQVGEHLSVSGAKRHTYGHSLAVDPWGRVLADLQNSPEIQVIELKRSEIEKVRTQIPMKHHRRLKIF